MPATVTELLLGQKIQYIGLLIAIDASPKEPKKVAIVTVSSILPDSFVIINSSQSSTCLGYLGVKTTYNSVVSIYCYYAQGSKASR